MLSVVGFPLLPLFPFVLSLFLNSPSLHGGKLASSTSMCTFYPFNNLSRKESASQGSLQEK